MINQEFSYSNYRKILTKNKSLIFDYKEIKNKNSFILLRHDVEFSPQRALRIAEIDHSENVSSSFLFQVRSNAYNVLSTINREIILQILELGHKVGLHFYVSHILKNDWTTLRKELNQQSEILNFAINQKIDRFSFHRPPKWVLENREDSIENLINMYGKSFFEFTDSPKEIKYIADSKHSFPYGHPLDDIKYPKIQILLHPDEWSEKGYDISENFKILENENINQIKLTFKTETKHFKEND